MSSSKTICPLCGNKKLPWFQICSDCHLKENQRPTCEICGIEVPEGHTLCKEHWKEKQNTKRHIKNIDKLKEKKEIEYKEKYKGKYYFNSMKVKSKSELLICYFLDQNGIKFSYEPTLTIEEKTYIPDFTINDDIGNIIIIEHYGMDNDYYNKRREEKDSLYNSKLPENFIYISTDEEDIYNLKDRLGAKLNTTTLKKVMWK